ncbi:LacI family DNA-binding transcriptional regulator [Paratractidigestivibacter sp.]|uniref:LacI family DNA-binding transcriptional regulator n=1 Tax=Paratractidigestivibacter sp. TaxID=2847316 RepID=UPI002ABD6382|nr:LacI family DNA-binding transcriptional regulator [Paratractidigestivibacter sp.]
MSKVTARDVAKAAGVSPATVSLVFRNKPGVGNDTRERVFSVARELGFEYSVPDTPRKTSTLLLIVYKSHGRVLADTSFFESLIKGVSDATYAQGYHRLSVSYFYAQQDREEQLAALKSVKCAGIILLATEMRAGDVAQFERLGVPIVLLDNWFPTKRLDSVVIDNTRGAWSAVRYLANIGHREIGYLHSSTEIRNFLERREGYLSAARSIDPDVNSVHAIVGVGPTLESAYSDMSAYLDNDPYLPTAFYADNDVIAMSCMRALQDHGYRVPEDISVMGFDDGVASASCNPPLTTMRVPKASMGALAVRRLVDHIQGKTGDEVVRIAVLPEIVQRESVGKPPEE